MNVYDLVQSTLSPIGLPVSLRVYNGSQSTYITYFEVVGVPALHADDELTNKQVTIQVDVWSKGNFISVVKEVESRMKEAGFRWSSSQDFYEDDTKFYHYALTYNYQVDL